MQELSDPTRLAILDALCSGPRTVTEIAGMIADLLEHLGGILSPPDR
ncbi:MAG: helix-turn-helix domain-containing protein [Acidimicrobiales bacterium]